MTTKSNVWFGPSTFFSMAAMMVLIVWGIVLPSSDETPGWVWALTLVVILAIIVGLIIGRIYRQIAFGIIIACLSPLVLLLALGIVGVIGKAVGAAF